MIVLTQIFHKLFPERATSVSLVQTALGEVPEENCAEGCEFLDEPSMQDELSGDEGKAE
jgi:hypothetical protein